MKAARYYGIHDIRVEEMPVPIINEDEVLIKVAIAAICGTDHRIYNYGHFKINDEDGRVLSHELAGEIVEIGKHVSGWKVGQRVATAPNIGCGHCPACQQGYNQLCPDYDAFGINLDGGFAEYMRVTAAALKGGNMVEIPAHLSYEDAVLAEPLSCVYNSWHCLGTRPGDSVLVIGAGPIGALHVAMNKLAGATKIITADISDRRLEEVKQFGSDLVVNSAKEDLLEFVMKHTDGQCANVVITACSVPDMQKAALDLASFHGRINFFGGMPKGKEEVTLNTNKIHYKELTVLGTTGSSIKDYRSAMDILASGRIQAGKLITGRFRLDEIHEAMDYMAKGSGMKTAILF